MEPGLNPYLVVLKSFGPCYSNRKLMAMRNIFESFCNSVVVIAFSDLLSENKSISTKFGKYSKK